MVLVACEESQIVCKAFRELGHEAFSCDIQDCSGGHPEWHIKDNVLIHLNDGWDLMIGHPPCDFMSKAGARWMYQNGQLSEERFEKAMRAREFFMNLYDAPIPKIAIENPQPLNIINLPKFTQSIQPCWFGHPYTKKTLLWLKNLPKLRKTKYIFEYTPYLPSNTGGKKKGQKYHYTSISKKDASKTFEGIAKAMAEQWSNSEK